MVAPDLLSEIDGKISQAPALKIKIVAHGTVNDINDDAGMDPYAIPKELGIFHVLPSSMESMTVENICDRIRANHERFSAKVRHQRNGRRRA